jgi:hypothetical protein
MAFLNRAAAIGIEGLTAAVSFSASYYVGLALLSIIMVVVMVHAYRVWEEIHDVEEPDSPSELLDSFEQAYAEGELDARELDRLRKILVDGAGAGGERTDAPGSRTPTPTATTITDPRALGGTQPEGSTENDVSGELQ